MAEKFKNYFTGVSPLEVSFATLMFMSRWLSVTMIIMASELLIQYGVLGSIGFIIAFVLAFIVYSFVGRSITITFSSKNTLGEVIAAKTTDTTKHILLILILLLSIGMIVIQAFSINLMLQTIFQIPLYMSQLLFYLFCFLFIVPGGIKRMLKLEPLFVAIIFSTVILIPVYFFIQKGIQPVYDGIWLYHPYLLYWKNNDGLFLFFTSFLLIFSLLIVDRISWQRLFQVKPQKVNIALSLSGVINGTILLALISMILISLSKNSYHNASTVFFNLITELHNSLLIGLFVGFCIIVSASAIGAEIQALISLFVKNLFKSSTIAAKRSEKQLHYMLAGGIFFFLLIISFFSPESIFESIFLYGVICTAMVWPMLIIIYGNRTIPVLYMYGVIFSIFCGWFIYFYIGQFSGLWVSFLLSGAFSSIFLIKERISSKRKSS
ncbi:hypothetical protein GLV94_02460 [Virgibacillus halodenitrificans]|uniref:hypothetical protein n=1 Tax=Virgibacillus halodenitrificans TaxID=1482 RepID=UPI00136A1B15|nr:hypothetical protein [Virgibacillus halodenitrificans]MYL44496.1 hypothetical protein [Virgibacillus halodenitrificans]